MPVTFSRCGGIALRGGVVVGYEGRMETVAKLGKSRSSGIARGFKRITPNRTAGYAMVVAGVVLLLFCYMQIGPFPPSAFLLLITSGLLLWAGIRSIRRKLD